MAIDHKKKRQDAQALAVAIMSNPSFSGLSLLTDAQIQQASTQIAKFCRELAYKLQDES